MLAFRGATPKIEHERKTHIGAMNRLGNFLGWSCGLSSRSSMKCQHYNCADELRRNSRLKMHVPPQHSQVARFEERFDPGRSLLAPSLGAIGVVLSSNIIRWCCLQTSLGGYVFKLHISNYIFTFLSRHRWDRKHGSAAAHRTSYAHRNHGRWQLRSSRRRVWASEWQCRQLARRA